MINLSYPLGQKLAAEITLPGSKYLANRLLILTALSQSKSILFNMPHNEDIDTAIAGLTALGADYHWSEDRLDCTGMGGNISRTELLINSQASGSFSRFVLPLLALFKHSMTLSGTAKMNSRPMGELFRVLEQLGATINSPSQEPPMTLPIKITGPIHGGQIEMSGATSSQYISALLMSAAKLPQGLQIQLTAAPVSKPYLQMTVELLALFGIDVETDANLTRFSIAPDQQYRGIEYHLESDPSSASYFLAAAAITQGHICITNFHPDGSTQGEAQFSKILQSMGCRIWQDGKGYHCQGPERLTAVSVDMGDMPDVVQTLAVVAMFAEGTTVMSNIANLAYKESNRIEDTAREIRKTGIRVSTNTDSLSIQGGKVSAATLDTHDDHRMAMSLALIALKVSDINIKEHQVVGKSFPNYWQYLGKIGYALDQVQ